LKRARGPSRARRGVCRAREGGWLPAALLLALVTPGLAFAQQADSSSDAPTAVAQASAPPPSTPPAGAEASAPASTMPAASAASAAPPPDKSGFTLFNPTPAADLRPFCTDRPTKASSPCTVDAGYFQIESDVFNVTIAHAAGVSSDVYVITDPTLKLGLTNTVDLEVSIAPYEIITTRDRDGVSTRQGGIGDLFVHVKWNLLGDDGGNVSFAISPYVKVPTAPLGIGDGAVEGGGIAILNINLPKGWSVTFEPEADLLEDASGQGTHLNVSGLASFSHPLSKEVTGSIEFWTDVDFDPIGDVTQVSGDLALAWIPASQPTLQFDCGVNFGLNRETPIAQFYVGVSHRF